MKRRLSSLLQEFFGISRKEARGALALICICLVLIWAPFVFRRWILPLFPLPGAEISQEQLDSLATRMEAESVREKKKFGVDPKVSPPSHIEVKLFKFDPNTASTGALQRLGIPAFLAKRIDKFRSKGGKFKQKADLLKIYDFPAELYKKLESLIVLPAQTSAQSETDHRVEKLTKANFPGEAGSKYVRQEVKKFDINTADTTQLIRLRGIGSKLSVRILKFRDGLGGFHSIDQFSEIFGLDSIALGELRKYAQVLSAVRKININTATPADLGKHPYLRDRKINTVIVNYRDQNGTYGTVDDLKKTKVVDDQLIRKIAPYLTCQ